MNGIAGGKLFDDTSDPNRNGTGGSENGKEQGRGISIIYRNLLTTVLRK